MDGFAGAKVKVKNCGTGARAFSNQLRSYRRLTRSQERFYQFGFAADDHSWKTFEPSFTRHFRFAVEPVGEQSELIGGYFAGTNSIEQMIQ